MWMDWFGEDGDIIWGAETASEQSEQNRGKAAAAWAGIQQARKDEKKAKRFDHLLSELIQKLLSDKQYDHIIEHLVPLLEETTPSHVLYAILILLDWEYIQGARTHLGLQTPEVPSYPVYEDIQAFSEPLHAELQRHVNTWFETAKIILVQDPSEINTKKFQRMLKNSSKNPLVQFSSHVFGHFLYQHNIRIPENKARSYAGFIVSEVEKLVVTLFGREE